MDSEDNIIKNNLEHFRWYIDKSLKAGDLIAYSGFFTDEQLRHFRQMEKQNPTDATKEVIDAIEKMTEYTDRYTRLAKALDEAGYPKIVKILKGQIIPVNDCHRKTIQSSLKHIYTMLSTTEVLPHLYSTEVIDVDDMERIKLVAEKESPRTAALELLLILPNRSREWFKHFIDALKRTCQRDLSELIHNSKTEEIQGNIVYLRKTSCAECLSTIEVRGDDENLREKESIQAIRAPEPAYNDSDTETVDVDSIDHDPDSFCKTLTKVIEKLQFIKKTIGSNSSLLSRISKAVNISKLLSKFSKFDKDLDPVQNVCKVEDTKIKRSAKYISKPNKSTKTLVNRKAKRSAVVNIKAPSDEIIPRITGSVFMPDGELVICDASNKNIKVFDANFKYKNDLQTSGCPWDIAVLSDKACAVTLPIEKKFQFVNVFPSTEVSATIEMDKMCHGIAVADDQIFITCYDTQNYNNDVEIKVLTKLGDPVKRIDCAHLELEKPCCIDLSYTADRLFVGDFATSTLTCFTKNGDLEYQYKDKDMKNPTSLFVDAKDNVLLCGRWSHNIQVVLSDGEKHGTLLNGGNKLNHPLSICYRDTDNKIAVSLTDKVEILIFELT